MKTESKRRVIDKLYDDLPSLNHKLVYKQIQKYCKNKKILDIGCWTGQLIDCMKNDVGEVLGICPGVEAIKYAQKKFSKYRNVSFKVSMAENYHPKHKKFDVVVMS